MTNTNRIAGWSAIELAKKHGLMLSKYADPTEGAREGLTVVEAQEIAAEDPGLVYVDASPLIETLVSGAAALVGNDGTGDLGVIVRQALIDDPATTVKDVARIVREAREDAAIDAAGEDY